MKSLTSCSDKGTLNGPDNGRNDQKIFFAISLIISEPDGLSKKVPEAGFEHITTPPGTEKYFIFINLHGGPKPAIISKDKSLIASVDRDSLWTFQIGADEESAVAEALSLGFRRRSCKHKNRLVSVLI